MGATGRRSGDSFVPPIKCCVKLIDLSVTPRVFVWVLRSQKSTFTRTFVSYLNVSITSLWFGGQGNFSCLTKRNKTLACFSMNTDAMPAKSSYYTERGRSRLRSQNRFKVAERKQENQFSVNTFLQSIENM